MFFINFISYKFKSVLVFIFVGLLLSSCASINNPLTNSSKSASNKVDSDLNKITQDLISGNLDEASQNINKLLVRQPENGQLHFLNGLDYHLQFVNGDPSKRDQAETGYLLALEFSPFDGKAARQLGYLYLELSRWRQAQARFSFCLGLGSRPPRRFTIVRKLTRPPMRFTEPYGLFIRHSHGSLFESSRACGSTSIDST